ncbi:acetyltransferase (GNAT) family protein [Albidovulum inexpectatum]|uniref:Acetyltransferase (GNAT) family protein n=1 Tax=Albidovulum inexpectatum TaxID=196587 RepID=A0A2S5JLG5_9RHOB|nr:GNAT family N-acetyltransferase [Albidovulum inexpectatum]PPB82397.1 acetyltransferase (GNAT) family protein [Albidovulum inexpectatum]
MTDLFAVTEATWPAAALHRAGAFVVRQGQGGGKRVSSATLDGPWDARDIAAAEAMHARLDQPSLFMIRPGEEALDTALAARGYVVVDPVHIFHARLDVGVPLCGPVPPVSAFEIWPPLAVMRDIWAEGGIGPERQAVMQRAKGPKTAILARSRDRAAGVAFVAIHDGTAMLHALHVLPQLRRQGSAVNIMRKAAHWAQDHGAGQLSVVVTRANAAACTLYSSLGMQIVAGYHYRLGGTKTGMTAR